MTYPTAMHSSGSYRYLPAIDPYSSGIAAQPGYEIVGLRFADARPVADGFGAIDQWLEKSGLPAAALAGLELRSPKPFAFGEFEVFNKQYRHLLVERDLLEEGVNPLARSNLIPVEDGPAEPVLLTAFVVRPSVGAGGRDFVVAGAGEVAEGRLDREAIVALGDTSQEGLLRKAEFVLDEMVLRLQSLGYDGGDPNLINVYTAHEISGLPNIVVAKLRAAYRHGFVRWVVRPPLVEIEFEMDLRYVSSWQVLGTQAR